MGQVFSLKRICKIPGPDCVIGAGRGARHLRTGGSAGGPLAFGVESRVMASAIPSLATDALPRAVRAALPPGGLFAEMQWRAAAQAALPRAAVRAPRLPPGGPLRRETMAGGSRAVHALSGDRT